MQERIRASVDRSLSEMTASSRCLITLDAELMNKGHIQVGDIVQLETDYGRKTLGRVGEPLEQDQGTGMVRIDRFIRQALKAKLNEVVKVEKKELQPVKRVVLCPPIDVSSAHHLIEHLTETFGNNESPVMKGSILYSTFHHSNAGTIFKVVELPDGPGYITRETKIEVEPPEARMTEGAYDVTFEDVGGVSAEIKLIRELIHLPLQFPQLYSQLGIQAPRGIVLYGPPGSGKTHLARAIANEINARFYYINGPTIVGTMYGETESNLRKIFSEAAHHAPSVILIDELDAVAPRREHLGAQSDIRAVTQLLSLMDGLSKVDGVVLVGTTNRIDAIDVAMRRPGRFDREVYIGPPSAEGRLEILQIQSREMPLSERALDALPAISLQTHGFVGADLMELCREAGLNALRRSTSKLENHLDAFKLNPEHIAIEPEDFDLALTKISPSAIRESLVTIPDVEWSEIGGLGEVKKEIEDLVLKPLKNPERYNKLNIQPPRGILLYGPSGTGKTLLAKAIAKEAGVNFIALDGPEIFSKWLGESEEAIRHIFKVARQLAPSIIFFDQFDAIVPRRGLDSGTRTTERVVNQILSELDGIESMANIIVMGATNRLDLVDPSVLRSGRLGKHICLPLPNEAERTDILKVLLSKVPLDLAATVDHTAAQIAKVTEGLSGADLQTICEEAKIAALQSVDESAEQIVVRPAHLIATASKITGSKKQEIGVC